jgi:phosphoribosylanthranilate isomerase
MSHGRVRVKICGITSREDALAAIDAGADALGFNLYPASKRAISLNDEADWIVALPPFVERVAVLVNAPLEEALRVAAHPAIHAVQFHGDEDSAYCAKFAAESGRSFIKAQRLRDDASVVNAAQFSSRHVLLDADAGAAYGGTGTLIELGLARRVRDAHPELRIILAGGLRPGNVAAAIEQVRPFAVDVASGVEVVGNPRRKDPALIRQFICQTASAGGVMVQD